MQTGGANNDYIVPQCPSDGVSSLSFSPGANMFAAGSWNKEIRIWEIQQSINPKAALNHGAPVLCTDFSSDGQRLFSGGCDNLAKMWDLASSKDVTVGQHERPVKSLFWLNDINVLVTGSWDKSLKYWDTRQQKAAGACELKERLYAMDINFPVAVVGTAERHVQIIDFRKPTTPVRNTISFLKFQTRSVAVFPDRTGFAIGSIEGRCAICALDEKDDKNNFAFKCHRKENDRKEVDVYAVNSIKFNYQHGTFGTAGSDGTFVYWDKDARQKLKDFKQMDTSIACTAFNRSGELYAYAVSYDWGKGHEFADRTKPNQIYIHLVKPEEIKKKPKQ